ncbi:LysR substrate-binding domain-containing protein [Paracoccus sp. PS-1]|uniref:LysR substrate-binding domain-containing protein n=1 Tax=unclassified Paracoccus (in: a-proteobacteria) TaxID=2688777 RepID=UPI00048F2BCB|nr:MULTISPECIES: LysR substrate-binding domain-containing protein [unclassified Paracoccus (in: a-proteobacteria)]MDQ7263171.1 LysR substrate-binding domain-containing protein [Paracoccus sp. PS1]
MSLLPLNALRAFEAVARLKSFKEAAKALFVTQSAVSHQVRHLEEFLGVALFDRSGPRPRILPRGQELARTLSLSLAEIEAACKRVRSAGQAQPLVIAAIPSVAICWLIPRLSRFRQAHPEVALRVVYAMHGQEIDFRSTHFAFVFSEGPPAVPGVRVLGFLPGESAPVCNPSLLPGLGKAPPSAAGIKAAGLLHDTDTSAWRAWLSRAGDGIAPDEAGPVFEDFNLLRAAALAGQGVALCPLAMIRDDLDSGRLVQLSSVTVLENFGYYLLASDPQPADLAENALAFQDWAFRERDAGPADA